jgi:hypothetical protein
MAGKAVYEAGFMIQWDRGCTAACICVVEGVRGWGGPSGGGRVVGK